MARILTQEQREHKRAHDRAASKTRYANWPDEQKAILTDYKRLINLAFPEEKLQQQREWREKNTDKVKGYAKADYDANPEKFRKLSRDYFWDNHETELAKNRAGYAANPKYHIARAKKWKADNPERARATKRANYRKKYDTDPAFKIMLSLRGRLSKALRLQGLRKCASTENLLGCSIGRFMEYLKAHFKPGMTFNNYGQWHIDHRKPCAKFNLTEPEEQRACFNWLNLQPLWAKENLSKNDRFELPELQPA